MKLFNFYLLVAVLIAISFIASCNIEPYDGEILDNFGDQIACLEAVQNTNRASANFELATESNYTSLCTVYKAALENQIAICDDVEGVLQTTISSLGDCSMNMNACENLLLEVNEVKTAFENADESNYKTLCTSYKAILLLQINTCGDNNASIQAIIDGLSDCEYNSETPNDCDEIKMHDVFGQSIECNYDLYKGLEVVNVYIDEAFELIDRDNDGNNDHYSKILYITDGTAIRDNDNKFVSFTNNTYLLEVVLDSKGTNGLVPGLFKFVGTPGLNTVDESYLSGGYYGDKGCTDEFFCDDRLTIWNGNIVISGTSGNFELCFDILIDLDNNCFRGTYSGDFVPISL